MFYVKRKILRINFNETLNFKVEIKTKNLLYFLRGRKLKKILIVDDLRPFIEKEKSVLSRSDVHIFTATSARDALTIHKNVAVDLMVIDLDMPGISGDQLCSAIKNDPALKGTAVLMVTRPREIDIERCKRCGADDYVTKPIIPEALMQKAGSLLKVPVRKAYRAAVRVGIRAEKEGETFSALLVDISISGILIETEQQLKVGDSVRCTFFLPGSPAVTVSGEVVRRAEKPDSPVSQYGLRLKDLGKDAEQIIDSYIKSQIKPIE